MCFAINSPRIHVLYTIDRQTNQNLGTTDIHLYVKMYREEKKRWLDEKQLEVAALSVTCFPVDNKMYHFSGGDDE